MSEINKETLREVAKILYKKDVEFDDSSDPMTIITELQKESIERQRMLAETKYKHGFKNGSSELEKTLKSSFGLETELKGAELVESILEMYQQKGADTKELEKIKSDYEIKLKAIQEKNSEESKEYKGKYEELLFTLEKSKKEQAFNNAIAPFLTDASLDIPEDSFSKAIKIDAFKSQLSKVNHKITESGIQLLGSDGTQLIDELGRIVTFDEYAKKVAVSLFGVKGGKKPNFKSSENLTIEGLKNWLDKSVDKESPEYKTRLNQYMELMRAT